MTFAGKTPPKAAGDDFAGRFREIISDPLNARISRHPMAGTVSDGKVCLHNGIRVPLEGPGSYYGPFSQILIFNRGVHEPLEEYCFQELLSSLGNTPSMLELGAYWSHYSMWLKLVRPSAKVVMVEPEQENIQAGKTNFSDNGFDGQFIQDFVGKGHFSVDAFLRANNQRKLTILHSDIQGYEVEMLEGAKQSLLTRAIDYVMVSTHSQVLHEQVVKFLEAVGYAVEVSSDFDHQTTSFDGFVFATSPNAKRLFDGFHPLGRTEIVCGR